MYDKALKQYVPSLIFDNGMSLGVGDSQKPFKIRVDRRRAKMQPFATSVSKNRKALPDFKFDFDVVCFTDLLFSTVPDDLAPLVLNSKHFKVFVSWLIQRYPVDINGITVVTHLKSKGLYYK